jgi:hypothetical protein
MIPFDVDPSLHTEPREPVLDDGFSPPPATDTPLPPAAQPSTVGTPPPVESWLWEKSGF